MTTASPMLTDEALRDQLARRSGAGMVDAETEAIVAALDRVPPRSQIRAIGFAGTSPRRAAAGSLMALAAVLTLVFVALPAFRGETGGFAGYPAQRALTTAELGEALAGKLVATGETIVAVASIEIRRDVCPMDRYATIGVVAGLAPQVCVMDAGLPPVVAQASGSISGTFALRYLGPGYVLLLGQITTPAHGTTFRVTDDWPIAGKTFLVDGWLGALFRGPIPCPSPAVDPLTGYSADCAYTHWLSTDPTSDLAFDQWPSDRFSLVGNSRVVDATGVLEMAGLAPYDKPVRGVYVVRSVVTACPGASPVDSQGCGSWKVLGKVDALGSKPDVPSVRPQSTAVPSAPPSRGSSPTPLPPNSALAPVPPALIGAANEPLTWAQFQDLVQRDPARMDGRMAIVTAPPISDSDCAVRVVPNGKPPVCTVSANPDPAGIWAVRDTGGLLEIVGKISKPQGTAMTSITGLINTPTSMERRLFLIDAWLGWSPSNVCGELPEDPPGLCAAGAVLSYLAPAPSGDGTVIAVRHGDFQRFGSPDLTSDRIHGLFLVETQSGDDCAGDRAPGSICGTAVHIVARIEST